MDKSGWLLLFFHNEKVLFSETDTVFPSDTSITIYAILPTRDTLYLPAQNSLGCLPTMCNCTLENPALNGFFYPDITRPSELPH